MKRLFFLSLLFLAGCKSREREEKPEIVTMLIGSCYQDSGQVSVPVISSEPLQDVLIDDGKVTVEYNNAHVKCDSLYFRIGRAEKHRAKSENFYYTSVSD